jgi:hypothetical protein
MTYLLIIYYLSSFYDSVLQSGDIFNIHFFCEQLMDYGMQNFSVLILIIYSVPYMIGLIWNYQFLAG